MRSLTQTFGGIEIKLADAQYRYPSITDVIGFLEWDEHDELEFRVDSRDCDDYALQLMASFRSVNDYKLGNGAFGIAWGDSPVGYHAYNVCLCHVRNRDMLYIIEPQTDEMFIIHDSGYKTDFIMM
jgi:hypothetical protein